VRPVLYVGNQNYSSWSLRPWLALTWARIDFELRIVPLGGEGYTKRQMKEVLAVSPSGTVPALHVGDDVITDSLSISEWAAEQVPALWPADPTARALARSAACEMHSGFFALRGELPCNIRRRAEPRAFSEDARREIARVEAIWSSLRKRFGSGGPYLFGASPTIADAFYTPVATRFRTYGVALGPESRAYASALLENPAFRAWEEAGNREPWSMPQWDSA
jgi:glutathione S-transferase